MAISKGPCALDAEGVVEVEEAQTTKSASAKIVSRMVLSISSSSNRSARCIGMPQARKEHTVHQMQIGRFSIKFPLEDFVMIGHERPKFGHSCPTKPRVVLIS